MRYCCDVQPLRMASTSLNVKFVSNYITKSKSTVILFVYARNVFYEPICKCYLKTDVIRNLIILKEILFFIRFFFFNSKFNLIIIQPCCKHVKVNCNKTKLSIRLIFFSLIGEFGCTSHAKINIILVAQKKSIIWLKD